MFMQLLYVLCLVTAPRRKVVYGTKGGQIGNPAKGKNAEHGDYEHIEAMAVDHSPPLSDDMTLVRLVSVFWVVDLVS